jgi:hypothetical protein
MPQRVCHLLPLPVWVEQLAPTYARAHNRDADEVYDELKSGLSEARLWEPLCHAVWRALCAARPRLRADELVEKIANAMARPGGGPRPMPAPGKEQDGMAAVFAVVDVNVGRASETARAALATERGQRMLLSSLDVAGQFLSHRILAAAKPVQGPPLT